ncbi:MAG: DUF4097 domain-containing protein [Actinomycetota bacterium]|nr:DUF4097 domain-containing protein [Actinomycetota bacterium]
MFHTPEPVSLHVEIGAGDIKVHAHDGLTETQVIVDGRDADEATVEQRGQQIVVLAPRKKAGFFSTTGRELSVTVVLPTHSELSTRTGSADLVATGRYASGRIRSGSGEVHVDEFGDETVVETGSGGIRIDAALGDLRVKSGSGDVEVQRLARSAGISTGSGDVLLGASEHKAVVKSGSGDVRVNDAHTDVSLSTASGDLSVGVIRSGAVVAKAVSGDVSVGVLPAIPVWTDISCVSGRVSSTLEGAGQPEPDQDFIEIRATTVSGDIALVQL